MASTNKILFITTHFPPNNTGSAVIMGNLINGLEQGDVGSVITCANSLSDKDENINGVKVYKIFNYQYLLPSRLRFFARRILIVFAKNKIKKIVKQQNISSILGVYPDLDFLDLSCQVAEKCNIKFYPYLHDLPEGVAHKRFYGKIYKRIEIKTFRLATRVFVMSEGMKDLLYKRSKIQTTPLLHSYAESFDFNYDFESSNSIFWGGNIYSINKESVKRIHEYCKNNEVTLKVSSANKIEKLKKLGFENKQIEILPFLSREKYFQTLSEQKLLLLSIDWPDESDVAKDELSTIFPTKTIEYLLSGIPIVVHCPREYFLARFFEKYKCGLTITTRNQKNINKTLDNFLDNNELMKSYVKNGYETSKMFYIDSVTSTFYSILNKDSHN